MVNYVLRTDSNKYLSCLYYTCISISSDYTSAIRTDSVEEALALKSLAERRDSARFNVVRITVTETVISDEENEGGD